MKILLIVLLGFLFLESCSSYNFDNPLDKDGTNFMANSTGDDDLDGVINYLDDDDSDGVPNYKDADSKYSKGEYHLKLEQQLLASKENLKVKNDGSLKADIVLNNNNMSYIEVNNSVEFFLNISNVFDINMIAFDYNNDGYYEDSLSYKAISRMHYFSKKGIYNIGLFVRDNIGNLVFDSTKLLVFNSNDNSNSQKPEILLNGDDTVVVEKGQLYKDDGYVVKDDVFLNNELADFVYIDDNEYNTNYENPGFYDINYTVYDTDGNKAVATRVVEVK